MNLSTLASQSSQLVNELHYSSQILKHLCDLSECMKFSKKFKKNGFCFNDLWRVL